MALGLKTLEGQISRWLKKLRGYNFKIQHRLGRLHKNTVYAETFYEILEKSFRLDYDLFACIVLVTVQTGNELEKVRGTRISKRTVRRFIEVDS